MPAAVFCVWGTCGIVWSFESEEWSFRTAEILWRAAVAASAPSEGFGFRAPPVAEAARKASRCRPQVRERIAEARAENGEGAKLARQKDLEARLKEREREAAAYTKV